jgi:hypothetical protein
VSIFFRIPMAPKKQIDGEYVQPNPAPPSSEMVLKKNMNIEYVQTTHATLSPVCHVAASYRDDTCSICLERYDSRSNPAMMYLCGHAFHLQCAETWRQRSSACPLCWSTLIEVGLYFDPSELESPEGELIKGHDDNASGLSHATDAEEDDSFVNCVAADSTRTANPPSPSPQMRTQRWRRCLQFFCC